MSEQHEQHGDAAAVFDCLKYHASAGGEYEYRGTLALEAFDRICVTLLDTKAQRDELLAEVEEWRAIKAAYLIEYAARPNGFRPGQYRGHAHDIDGIWDRDNGTLAGCKCAACMMHQAAIANAEAAPCD